MRLVVVEGAMARQLLVRAALVVLAAAALLMILRVLEIQVGIAQLKVMLAAPRW
jgi:hypothetical protein